MCSTTPHQHRLRERDAAQPNDISAGELDCSSASTAREPQVTPAQVKGAKRSTAEAHMRVAHGTMEQAEICVKSYFC